MDAKAWKRAVKYLNRVRTMDRRLKKFCVESFENWMSGKCQTTRDAFEASQMLLQFTPAQLARLTGDKRWDLLEKAYPGQKVEDILEPGFYRFGEIADAKNQEAAFLQWFGHHLKESGALGKNLSLEDWRNLYSLVKEKWRKFTPETRSDWDKPTASTQWNTFESKEWTPLAQRFIQQKAEERRQAASVFRQRTRGKFGADPNIQSLLQQYL